VGLMRADYQITVDGNDVTAIISPRLSSLTIKDERGFTSDTLEIVIDDRPDQSGHYIELPRKGVTLQVALGYNGKLTSMGKFVIDEANPSGPVERITISGKAADMRASMKVRRTRGWDNITLADFVATIAATHQLKPKVSAALAAITIARIDQADESDLHLITRIGREFGAVVKPAYGFLLMVHKGEAKTATGQLLPEVVLHKSDLSHWDVTLADRDKYSSVVARYWDLNAADDIEVRAGDGEPEYRIRRTFSDQQSAQLAADAKLKSLHRGTGQMQVTTAGHPNLVAEATVNLTGMRPGLNEAWDIDAATHTLDKNGGWKVALDLEMKS